MLWDRDAVVKATGGVATDNAAAHGGAWQAAGISIDSRTAEAGDLFIAISGDVHDGHDHVQMAADAGAVAAIIARAIPAPIPALLVDDTLAALNQLAAAACARNENAKRIAITGSVGKTGTRHVVENLLAAHAKTHASRGNLNNHIGTPLSLARMPHDAAYGVFELGMNHSGEIAATAPLVAPHYAVITRIANSHIGHFDSLDDIADAKAEIFTGALPGGIAILNGDDAFADYLAAKARQAGAGEIITIGVNEGATHRIRGIARTDSGIAVDATLGGEAITFESAMTGTHNAYAAMFALAIAEHENLPRDVSLAALTALTDLDGRGRHHAIQYDDGRQFILIDDSYNASPASMQAALIDFATDPAGEGRRRIAILADMLELGKDSEALHCDIASPLRAAAPAIVICFGEGMRAMAETDTIRDSNMKIIIADDADAATAIALDVIRTGDLVLIKGSHGMHITRLAENLRNNTGGVRHAS